MLTGVIQANPFRPQSCFGQNLIYGGAQTCIFSLLVAFLTQGIVTLGLAELASAYPVRTFDISVDGKKRAF